MRPSCRFSTVLPLIAALAMSVLLPGLAAAQFDTATVLGTVRDPSGGLVPGVTVTLSNVATGITATAVSDQDGSYQFLNVRIGTYTIKAELSGFSTAVAENILVTVNARLRVDLDLRVGSLDERVVVTGSTPVLETESSDRGQVIGREQIVNLPLNGRNYADLALLAPGVRRSGISDSRDASFNVHGQRSALNNFILDGVDNNNYGTSNQGFSNQVVQVSPDAVQEFKVQTDNFSAEYGRTGGAVINASLRSGTNQFRGHRLGVPSQHRAQRHRLFQALLRRQADASAQPVRLRLRRANHPQPHVLLRRLRRLPADLPDRHVCHRPHAGAARGHPGQAGS